ncbi:MAG: hypothetical protein LCH39_13065 [Proteobacteria bacterium]|nr:hypothetical protein [Pseudomonadota bacterium]
MAGASEWLTGVWHGLYTYRGEPEPVYFVATLIQSGAYLSGSTLESAIGRAGTPLTLTALIEGARDENHIHFIKRYDGSAGWYHGVDYAGVLNEERTEIEGRWTIGSAANGRFLMIRSSGASERAVRRSFERV